VRHLGPRARLNRIERWATNDGEAADAYGDGVRRARPEEQPPGYLAQLQRQAETRHRNAAARAQEAAAAFDQHGKPEKALHWLAKRREHTEKADWFARAIKAASWLP
jgi:hypothetical protein